jgi:hypothetical protein
MSNFEFTRRTSDGYIDKKFENWRKNLLEVKPRIIDDCTIQIAMSRLCEFKRWTLGANELGRHKYECGLSEHIPTLNDALAWCRSRRMGAKYVIEQNIEVPDDFLAWAEANYPTMHLQLTGTMESERWCGIAGNQRVTEPQMKVASHRLVFRKADHAFEFKMRWL